MTSTPPTPAPTTTPTATLDALLDPVRVVRDLAIGNEAIAANLREAMLNICDEVESLRVEAFEAWRTDDELGQMVTVRQYRVAAKHVINDAPWRSREFDGVKGEMSAIELADRLVESPYFTDVTVETRTVMHNGWIEA